MSEDAANSGLIDREKYVIPPHLHDLHEADLPETQRGLVISEIAQFRERAAKREREKMRDVRESIPLLVPSGPKREWGKSQSQQATPSSKTQATGKGSQGYNKPAGFVKAESDGTGKPSDLMKSDEELEAERKEARRRDEENSFRDVRIDSHDYSLWAYENVSAGTTI
jgi:RNA-binding protein 25